LAAEGSAGVIWSGIASGADSSAAGSFVCGFAAYLATRLAYRRTLAGRQSRRGFRSSQILSSSLGAAHGANAKDDGRDRADLVAGGRLSAAASMWVKVSCAVAVAGTFSGGWVIRTLGTRSPTSRATGLLAETASATTSCHRRSSVLSPPGRLRRGDGSRAGTRQRFVLVGGSADGVRGCDDACGRADRRGRRKPLPRSTGAGVVVVAAVTQQRSPSSS
jgi:hypothetical protein